MLQNLQNFKFAKFQKFQLNNLVDLQKCCKMRIDLQRSVPIQPKTSGILPKIWPTNSMLAMTSTTAERQESRRPPGAARSASFSRAVPSPVDGELSQENKKTCFLFLFS